METSGKVSVLRCRKCRKCVVDASCLLTIDAVDNVATECRVWHMDFDNLPAWILTSIHQARWTSGRLSCQHCRARLGGFNFVNQAKCPCGLDLTVHLCKSRLDVDCRRPGSAGGAGRESRAVRPPLGAAAAAWEAPPPPAVTGCELWPTALEAWPHEADAGLSNGGTVPLPAPQRNQRVPECSGGPVKTARRKARALDCSGGGGAWTGQSGSLTDSQLTRPLGEEAQSGSALPQPHPTAAGQSELEERPETTPVQEVYTLRRRRPSLTSTDEGEETEEGAEQTAPLRSLQLDRAVVTHVASPRLSKRERNRLKSQRRKQRRRERWIQSRLQEHTQGLMGNVTSSEDEDVVAAVADRESLTCAVCLDIFFSPYMCQPCGHVFCEPCLRTLAKNRAASTPCPLCRTLITHVLFQKELSHTMKTFFPKLYLSRKQNFQKSGCSRWPLPSTRKLFHIFGAGFRRQPSPAGRRLFPHGGYGLGVLDTANSRGWRVEGVVLVYIRSINWLIGLSVCFFLCFLLFSSF
ncbi:E3 ubiquitin-protein ligase RNF180-like isoform X1 [Anguilla anguilla]|uniref:E3 ubiquitin-protein ligase RNF180-like isoform X1 n=1 Tax=Anguilla anguilla TaxID=7936 RepID=UPI0015ABB555|nr:E3 ubiquitin-protein ligase RNF180-like isoform X1 [Anguilla anguilla]XP_035245912.1 E3 ubiquitin-protein ligase RNF180-like isoform X1 [Anguilla anguilla]